MTYSDDDLKRYLAGQMPQAETEALDVQVANDPALEARLLSLEPFAALAKASFSEVPTADRLSTVNAVLEPKPKRRWPLGVALAACLAGAIGLGIGTFNADDASLGWREQIAVYQALYVPATIAPIASTDTDLRAQFSAGSQALGLEVQPDMMLGLDNLNLKRAQILQADEKTILQIVLADANGEPLAFCIVHLGEGAVQSEPQVQSIAGLPTTHWVDGAYGYMLLGRVNADQMSNATEVLRARFSPT